MRIYSVTPIHVSDEELARRQARYDELLPDGLTLDLHDIGPDAPTALDTDADVRASEEAVIAALRAAPESYDVLLPDCVLDPGVAALSDELPIVGLLQLSLGWQAIRGRRVGAVVRNRAIADEFAARARVYGFADHLADVEVLDLGVDAIADHDQWDTALDAALAHIGADTRWVINGCSAVPVDDRRAVEVIDPTALALRLLAAGGVS